MHVFVHRVNDIGMPIWSMNAQMNAWMYVPPYLYKYVNTCIRVYVYTIRIDGAADAGPPLGRPVTRLKPAELAPRGPSGEHTYVHCNNIHMYMHGYKRTCTQVEYVHFCIDCT